MELDGLDDLVVLAGMRRQVLELLLAREMEHLRVTEANVAGLDGRLREVDMTVAGLRMEWLRRERETPASARVAHETMAVVGIRRRMFMRQRDAADKVREQAARQVSATSRRLVAAEERAKEYLRLAQRVAASREVALDADGE